MDKFNQTWLVNDIILWGDTNILASPSGKAQDFDSCIVGSNPAASAKNFSLNLIVHSREKLQIYLWSKYGLAVEAKWLSSSQKVKTT